MAKKSKKGKGQGKHKPTHKPTTTKTTPPVQSSETVQKPSSGGGPKTPEGKAISSNNSLEHGLTARRVVLPNESFKEYEAFKDKMMNDLLPVGEFETEAARRYIDNSWRMRRFAPRETDILSTISDINEQSRQLALLSRYERSVRRNMEKDLAEFNAHKRNRIFDEIEDLRDERIRKANGQPVKTDDLQAKAYRVIRQTMNMSEMLKFLSQPMISDHFEFVSLGFSYLPETGLALSDQNAQIQAGR